MIQLVEQTMTNRPDTALIYAQRAVALSRKENDNPRLAQTLLREGRSLVTRQDYAGALTRYDEGLAVAVQLKDTFLMARFKGNQAIIYETQGRPQEALSAYQAITIIFEDRGMMPQAAKGYSCMGALYTDVFKDYPLALEYNLKAVDILSKLPDDTYAAAQGIAMERTAYTYQQMQENDKAIGYLLKAIQLYRKSEDKLDEAHAYNKLYENYFVKKDFVKGRSYLEKSRKLAEELGSRYTQMIVAQNMGELLIAEKNYKEAVIQSNRALEMAQDMENKLEQAEAYKFLAEAYKKMGKRKDAAKYLGMSKKMEAELHGGEPTAEK